jgi:hypothetical protein
VSVVNRLAREIETNCKVPAVGVAGANVAGYRAYLLKYSNGMPIRSVAVPFPVAGQPRSVLKGYVEGNDPLTGQPVIQSIIDGLTKPLTEEELMEGMPPEGAPEPRLLKPDTEANLHRLFKDNEWTDFNSIILPTEERVAAMLKATSRKPDEVVGRSSGREMTVEKAAIFAVMADARPEYFPTILAALTRSGGFGNSTSSAANMIVVNGPVIKELGVHSGMAVMSPMGEANSAIGRSFTLAGKMLGDVRVKGGAYSSIGSALQYNNITIAENEDLLPPGWDPLSVTLGFKSTDNVVSIGSGWSYISSVGEAQLSHGPHMLMGDYMKAMVGGSATIIMDPTVAGLLKDAHGFKTKAELSQWLTNYIEVPAATYWGQGVNATANEPLALQGLEPYATWRKLSPKALIKPFMNPKAISVIVTGGNIQTTWFATDFRFSNGILIDDWK